MRVAGALLLFVVGAATSLATVALHARWWGLLLGAAATLVSVHALPRGWLTRLPFGLGFAALVAVVAPTRPEGDYVISADVPGYGLLGLALVVVVWSVATLPRPGAAARDRPHRSLG